MKFYEIWINIICKWLILLREDLSKGERIVVIFGLITLIIVGVFFILTAMDTSFGPYFLFSFGFLIIELLLMTDFRENIIKQKISEEGKISIIGFHIIMISIASLFFYIPFCLIGDNFCSLLIIIILITFIIIGGLLVVVLKRIRKKK